MIHIALAALLTAAPVAEGPPAHLIQDAESVPQAAPAARPAPRLVVRPAQRRRAAPRRVVRQAEPIQPLPGPIPSPAAPQVDIAPTPNRAIEPPRGPSMADAPRVRPDFIDPQSLPDSRRQGVNDFNDRADRFARNPAAGARLDIPFRY